MRLYLKYNNREKIFEANIDELNILIKRFAVVRLDSRKNGLPEPDIIIVNIDAPQRFLNSEGIDISNTEVTANFNDILELL
jgi:hypothetical protein